MTDLFYGLVVSSLEVNDLLLIVALLAILAVIAFFLRGKKIDTKDVREMVRADRSFFEKIVFYIPVYHGYKEREDRREADKILREHLADKLKEVERDLKDVYRNAMAADLTEISGKLDSVVALFDKMRSKILHADYGYASFWGALKIREEELDRMYEFDAVLVEIPSILEKKVQAVSKTVEDENIKTAAKALNDLSNELKDLEKAFNKRKEFMLKINVGG